MSISFQCSKCGKKLKAPDSAAGKSSPCPGCGTTVVCPEAEDDDGVGLSSTNSPGKSFNPYADLDDDVPPAIAPLPADQAPSETRRPCPACGESIVANAAKCRFCGEVFDTAPIKPKGKAKKKSKKHSADDEVISTVEMVVAVLCSGIGCIVGIVWMIQGKPKGLKMFGLSIAMAIFWNILNVVIQLSLRK